MICIWLPHALHACLKVAKKVSTKGRLSHGFHLHQCAWPPPMLPVPWPLFCSQGQGEEHSAPGFLASRKQSNAFWPSQVFLLAYQHSQYIQCKTWLCSVWSRTCSGIQHRMACWAQLSNAALGHLGQNKFQKESSKQGTAKKPLGAQLSP